MEVAPDGKVKMTDLLNNDRALQKKLDIENEGLRKEIERLKE